LSNSIYIIIINVVQTKEIKDDKVIKKVDDPRNDLNIKEQSKDPRGDLETVEKNIGPILDPNLDSNLLKKPPIAFKLFNIRIKIFKNAFYIVTKTNIYIFSKDLREVRIF